MKFDWQGRSRSNSLVVVGPLAIAMTVILALDTFTDYAIAAAVFYTAIILIATRLLPQRSVVVLACISVLLTVVSFAFTQSGAYEVGLVNTAISIVAIAVTTYLSQKLVAALSVGTDAVRLPEDLDLSHTAPLFQSRRRLLSGGSLFRSSERSQCFSRVARRELL